jgi:6-phosphogluconolactonase
MTDVVFVGTYTQKLGHVDGKGKGIYAFSLDRATGALTPLATTEDVGPNPTYLAATATTLYVVNETGAPSKSDAAKPTGYVKAYAIGPQGTLTLVNAQETAGSDACHVALSPSRDFLTVANYGGGNLSLYPVNATDGSIGAATDMHAFSGASMAVPDRQEAPHVHSTTWHSLANGKDALIAADLGNDVVAQFVLNKTAQKLEPNAAVAFAARPAGSGPRHFAVHAGLQVAYVLDELSSTVGVHPIDVTSGALSRDGIQTISMLPDDFNKADFTLAADVHVSPCGKFLYASNRGHDSLACFRIDQATGTLTSTGHVSTRGQAPRAFQIFGSWLLAANQNTDTIEVFAVDEQTGALTFTGHSAACPTPVTLALVPSA